MSLWKVCYRLVLWPVLVVFAAGFWIPVFVLLLFVEWLGDLAGVATNWIQEESDEAPWVEPPWYNDEEQAAKDAERRLRDS